MLFHMIIQNHKIPDLIWNETTRLELRKELETELRNYEEKRLRGGSQVAWNFQQYTVYYPSLRHEMQVGPIYVRHFLEADASFLRSIGRPSHTELFERPFVAWWATWTQTRTSILCARCLVRLYSVCWDLVGSSMTPCSGYMLEQSGNLELQHCLLELLDRLSRVDLNLPQLLNGEFVDVMVRYASLAHLNPDQIGNAGADVPRTSTCCWKVQEPVEVIDNTATRTWRGGRGGRRRGSRVPWIQWRLRRHLADSHRERDGDFRQL